MEPNPLERSETPAALDRIAGGCMDRAWDSGTDPAAGIGTIGIAAVGLKPFLRALVMVSALGLLLSSCGSSGEVIVVENAPKSAASENADDPGLAADTSFGQRLSGLGASGSATSRVLRIGVLEPIRSFDPHLASTIGEMQAVRLLYERLFELSPTGQPVPSLVASYSISGDGLTYTFELKDDRYYSDSRIFSNGLGRRVSSADVRFMIERAAGPGVPPHISALFSSIKGFEIYSAEQRSLYDPSKRSLEAIPGIELIDDLTLRIHLERPDQRFLLRLSSPFASIHPSEAFRAGNSLLRSPVGSGAYRLEDQVEDPYLTHIALKPGETGADPESALPAPGTTRSASQPGIESVSPPDQPWSNILWTIAVDSTSTLDRLRSADLDWVPEIGPQLERLVISESSALATSPTTPSPFMGDANTPGPMSSTPGPMTALRDLSLLRADYPNYYVIDGLPAPFNPLNGPYRSDGLSEDDLHALLPGCTFMDLDGLPGMGTRTHNTLGTPGTPLKGNRPNGTAGSDGASAGTGSGSTNATPAVRFTMTTHAVEIALADVWAASQGLPAQVTPLYAVTSTSPHTIRRVDGFHVQLGLFPQLTDPRLAVRCVRQGLTTTQFAGARLYGAEQLEPWTRFNR